MMRKLTLILTSFMALTALSACSTVPDRYSFWSDDIGNVHDDNANGEKSNLGDVPASPSVDDARDELDDIRRRLETDNGDAYSDQEDALFTSPSVDIQSVTELAPDYPSFVNNPSVPVYTPNTVQVNYGAFVPQPIYQQPDSYVYGNSPAIYGSYYDEAAYSYEAPAAVYSPYGQEISTLMAENSSITINPLPSFGGDGTLAAAPILTAPEGQLLFNHGSSKLSKADKDYIKQLTDSLQSSYSPLRIIGHASKRVDGLDPIKGRLVNLKMSEKRAAAVYKEFAKNGITADRLNLTAHGDSVPNLPLEGLDEEAADRRVEIVIEQ